jgi:hypothetical protein
MVLLAAFLCLLLRSLEPGGYLSGYFIQGMGLVYWAKAYVHTGVGPHGEAGLAAAGLDRKWFGLRSLCEYP